MSPNVLLPPSGKKNWVEGGVADFWPLPSPPPKKKRGGRREGAVRRPHTTFLDAAQLAAIQISMPSVAAQRIILSRSLVTGPHHEITVSAGDREKKRDDVFMDGLRLKSLRVMLSDSLLRIYSQSWGSSVDALNTTYPSPLPDHRVLLTVVFVPFAHALASTPTGCITMIYFCT